jgi:hypothetical protein
MLLRQPIVPCQSEIPVVSAAVNAEAIGSKARGPMSEQGHSRRFAFTNVSVVRSISDSTQTLPEIGDVPNSDVLAYDSSRLSRHYVA